MRLCRQRLWLVELFRQSSGHASCRIAAAAVAFDRAAIGPLGTARRLCHSSSVRSGGDRMVIGSHRLATAASVDRAAVGSFCAAGGVCDNLVECDIRSSGSIPDRCGLRATVAFDRAAEGLLHATGRLADRVARTGQHSAGHDKSEGNLGKHGLILRLQIASAPADLPRSRTQDWLKSEHNTMLSNERAMRALVKRLDLQTDVLCNQRGAARVRNGQRVAVALKRAGSGHIRESNRDPTKLSVIRPVVRAFRYIGRRSFGPRNW